MPCMLSIPTRYACRFPSSGRVEMLRGNMPYDGGYLLLSRDELIELNLAPEQQARFIRRIYGSSELIRGLERYCIWIEDEHLNAA